MVKVYLALLRNCQTVFQRGCTTFHSPVASHPLQHVMSVFWILVILIRVWYLILICISLIIYDVKHLFICLFAICILYIFFGEMSVKILGPFFVFLSLSFQNFFVYFGLQFFIRYVLCRCIFPSFQSLDTAFCNTEVFNFEV